jgi:monomeric sarcosine oxidase
MELLKETYDTAVIGLGGAGSSSLYYLSQTKQKVIGIEQYEMNHNKGSSHGDTRIIRQAYFEGEYYVPFVKDAYKLWNELEKKTGKQLYLKTGGLNITNRAESFVEMCRIVCDIHDISYTILDNNEISQKYPYFSIEDDCIYALEEENAGILFPDKCIDTFITEAKNNGAEVSYSSIVKRIEHEDLEDGSRTYTVYFNKDGVLKSIKAKSIVLSAGPWINNFLYYLYKELPFTVDVNLVYYFKTKDDTKHKQFPIFLFSKNNKEYYGFPDVDNGNGYKISIYLQNKTFVAYDDVNREFDNEQYEDILTFCQEYLTEFKKDNMKLDKYNSCLYTSTPDKDFVLDYVPNTNETMVLVSACSGHGFKFMSRIGDHVSKLVTKTESPYTHFKIDRLFK